MALPPEVSNDAPHQPASSLLRRRMAHTYLHDLYVFTRPVEWDGTAQQPPLLQCPPSRHNCKPAQDDKNDTPELSEWGPMRKHPAAPRLFSSNDVPGFDYKAVPLNNYFRDIICFSRFNLVTQTAIRDYMLTTCKRMNMTLRTGTMIIPTEDIPPGYWTVAFAPSILSSGAWVLAFAAPSLSQTIWHFWPEKRGTGDELLQFLDKLAAEDKLKNEDAMLVGTPEHKLFHAMVEQMMWREENTWLTAEAFGEFREVVE